MEYTSRQVRQTLERYQEFRSAVELVTTNFSPVRSKGGNQQKSSDTICLLVDIDNAMSSLTPRQYLIVNFVRQGYTPEEIHMKLDISLHAIKFHFTAAIFRILTYLNS